MKNLSGFIDIFELNFRISLRYIYIYNPKMEEFELKQLERHFTNKRVDLSKKNSLSQYAIKEAKTANKAN